MSPEGEICMGSEDPPLTSLPACVSDFPIAIEVPKGTAPAFSPEPETAMSQLRKDWVMSDCPPSVQDDGEEQGWGGLGWAGVGWRCEFGGGGNKDGWGWLRPCADFPCSCPILMLSHLAECILIIAAQLFSVLFEMFLSRYSCLLKFQSKDKN